VGSWEAKWPRLLPLPPPSSRRKAAIVVLSVCNGSGVTVVHGNSAMVWRPAVQMVEHRSNNHVREHTTTETFNRDAFELTTLVERVSNVAPQITLKSETCGTSLFTLESETSKLLTCL
jgi:hypothetical protein